MASTDFQKKQASMKRSNELMRRYDMNLRSCLNPFPNEELHIYIFLQEFTSLNEIYITTYSKYKYTLPSILIYYNTYLCLVLEVSVFFFKTVQELHVWCSFSKSGSTSGSREKEKKVGLHQFRATNKVCIGDLFHIICYV